MMLKILILTSSILMASGDDQFGISSAFFHISTPPKQVAFIDLGEYSGQTINGVGYKKNYYFSKFFKATWVEAKAICKSFDLELATFETSIEAQTFINKIVNIDYFANNNNYIYALVDGIALTPRSTTDWYWSNSGEQIPYNMQWADGEPNSITNDENCLSIGRSNRNSKFGFNDHRCDYYPFSFVCQKTVLT